MYAALGETILLECLSISNPNTINYWLRSNNHKTDTNAIEIVHGGIYESSVENYIHRKVMKLQLKIYRPSDYGSYSCVAKNQLGTAEEIIKVIRMFSKN